jgi:hypothetical protein
MKRRLKIAALIISSFVLVLLLFLGWVVYTEAGLRFAVARLPERLGKVTLKIENVHGTIAGGFGADRVDVDQERTHVRVDKGTARVNVWPLLVGRIAVREARSELVLIELKKRLRPPPKTPPKFLPRLLSISAEAAFTTAWSSSTPAADAPSSPKSAAPASLVTRRSGFSKAASSMAIFEATRSACCVPPRQ